QRPTRPEGRPRKRRAPGRPTEVRHPPEENRDERRQDLQGEVVRIQVRHRGEQDPGQGGERSAQRPGGRSCQVRVDAHEGGGRTILSRTPHSQTDLAEAEEGAQTGGAQKLTLAKLTT